MAGRLVASGRERIPKYDANASNLSLNSHDCALSKMSAAENDPGKIPHFLQVRL